MAQEKINATNVHIGEDTSLLITAPNVKIRSLDLQKGAMVVRGDADSHITVDGAIISNKGWEWVPLDRTTTNNTAAEEDIMRGFIVKRKEQYVIDVSGKPGNHLVS